MLNYRCWIFTTLKKYVNCGEISNVVFVLIAINMK